MQKALAFSKETLCQSRIAQEDPLIGPRELDRLIFSELTPHDVHIWPIRLIAPTCLVDQFYTVLDSEERCEVNRLRLDYARREYIVRRAALRLLIGHYLDIPSNSIRYSYQANGKPFLRHQPRLTFNASHTRGLALCAFAMEGNIGVDVELVYGIPDALDIATRYFCIEESADLMSLTGSDLCHAFFLCWTRKEAYVKATGYGLSTRLDSFQVTCLPWRVAKFIHIENDPAVAASWELHNIDLGKRYAGALAYQKPLRSVRLVPTICGYQIERLFQAEQDTDAR